MKQPRTQAYGVTRVLRDAVLLHRLRGPFWETFGHPWRVATGGLRHVAAYQSPTTTVVAAAVDLPRGR